MFEIALFFCAPVHSTRSHAGLPSFELAFFAVGERFRFAREGMTCGYSSSRPGTKRERYSRDAGASGKGKAEAFPLIRVHPNVFASKKDAAFPLL
jgi:hypothetical protein